MGRGDSFFRRRNFSLGKNAGPARPGSAHSVVLCAREVAARLPRVREHDDVSNLLENILRSDLVVAGRATTKERTRSTVDVYSFVRVARGERDGEITSDNYGHYEIPYYRRIVARVNNPEIRIRSKRLSEVCHGNGILRAIETRLRFVETVDQNTTRKS